MDGYIVNLGLNVHSDQFCDLLATAKTLWLFLYHEAFDPMDDTANIFYDVNAISRALGVFDHRNISELVRVNALIPVTNPVTGGVTHE